MLIEVALAKLMIAWNASYCYTGDDGDNVFESIVKLAQVTLSMPDATFEEMLTYLREKYTW